MTKNKGIPGGGGKGKNSAWLFKTNDGYQATERERERSDVEGQGTCHGGQELMTAKGTTGGSKMPASQIGPSESARADLHVGVDEDLGTGTSIFDPVLCELVYRWFCPPGGHVLDPFAGGSVRGIVANKLGRRYTGIELRADQIRSNEVQAQELCPVDPPVWVEGDSIDLDTLCPDVQADLLFSCPPYFDLEVYSDDPRDLSAMQFDGFQVAYKQIIAAAVTLLKPDRFACFVIGDTRGPDGFYRGLIGETVAAFREVGLGLYNEAILITAVGSLPIRAGKIFAAARKLGKTHQHVLVFCKGDPKKATEAIGEVEHGTELS